jgi:bisphosphoglycerate-independent phosphoglycerate mutase (AlkP superfamily)
MMSLLQTIHNDLQEVKAEQKKQGQTLTGHIATEPEEWAELLKDTLVCAFPGGDAEGHRRYHEETIVALEARAEFWKKMVFEITKYGLFGVLGWLAYTVWAAFLHGPQK